MLWDWVAKFAPFFQPIAGQTKTNCDLIARVFPRLTTRRLQVFSSNSDSGRKREDPGNEVDSDWFILLFTSAVIGQSNYFGLHGFTILDQKTSLLTSSRIRNKT